MIAPQRCISGRVVDLLDFKPEDVNAYDIAWALHMTNRYNGHTPIAWSVLSHTGLMYRLGLQYTKGKLEPATALTLMLHDAAEAYTGDMCGPLKRSGVMGEFVKLENAILDTIFIRFGLQAGKQDWELVNKLDAQALYVEYYRLFPQVRDTADMPKLEYPLTTIPTLVVGKPQDYVQALRSLAINAGTEKVSALFDLPDTAIDLFSPPEVAHNKGVEFESPDNRDMEKLGL